ncbi:hypothetical protein K504DRAFT_472624 [Pleomassaria siparia CBS 279.74]|uniref:Cyclin N-terminal domain-containing protein n=1 Tax=Pleomassaria siparia CBS 279.74 TaxID=1314801 RepID=A0A6G1KK26_9PLEO|nr:hypothetical protein K504DRAFT_472624 [Pleomassaria siparia CBS 279.74]
MSEEELELYFASYVPLSSLPTPPPAKTVSIPAVQQKVDSTEAETPELEAHATYLSKLIPSNVSTQAPSMPIVADFLFRANLPIEMLAFTACILDALSHRFAASFRTASLPCTPTPFRYVPLFAKLQRQPPVRPEVVILAALSLAHGWLEDQPRSTAHWASVEGAAMFTTWELESAKTCILKDVDYGLFRITDKMVQRMLAGLRANATGLARQESGAFEEKEKRPKLSLKMRGAATWVHGMQTPEPSP